MGDRIIRQMYHQLTPERVISIDSKLEATVADELQRVASSERHQLDQ